MFLGNPQKSSTAASVSTGGLSKTAATVNTHPLLGPTATANVNLGGVQGGSGQYNQAQYTPSNQMGASGQSTLNQGAQNTVGQNAGSQNQGSTGPSPMMPSYATPYQTDKPGSQPSGPYGNSYYPPNQSTAGGPNQTPQYGPQSSSLVQPVAGPGQQTQGSSKPNQPGPYSQNNLSTAQTSKNTSVAGPVGTQNKPATAPRPPPEQNNGAKQSGPALAITTNFKKACDTKHKPNTQERIVVPWDHSKKNYVFTDQAFDKLRRLVTKDQVKSVGFCNL